MTLFHRKLHDLEVMGEEEGRDPFEFIGQAPERLMGLWNSARKLGSSPYGGDFEYRMYAP